MNNIHSCYTSYILSLLPPPFFFRNMWKAVAVTLVVMVTTPWSSETPWAVCRVHVTSMALCQRVYVICGPDSVHAEKGRREHSVPTVPTTTTTGVYSSRVRKHRAEANITSKFSSCLLVS